MRKWKFSAVGVEWVSHIMRGFSKGKFGQNAEVTTVYYVYIQRYR
jgi:hypothetical protein